MTTAEPGTWREVDNQSEIFTEIDAYGEVRRLLPMYTCFLRKLFRQNLDAVDCTINGLPRVSELMHGFYREHPSTWIWHYQSAYFEYSETNRFSRSWLLATLPDVFQALAKVRRNLTEAEQALQRANHARLYEKLLTAYETWHTLAASRLRVPLSALRKREQLGRLPRARVKSNTCHLSQLLDQLLHTNCD